jgi:hypothetical protein
MQSTPFSAVGSSFEIHEWCGSGPATLHVHHSEDEAWHVLDGKLMFLSPRFRLIAAWPTSTKSTDGSILNCWSRNHF